MKLQNLTKRFKNITILEDAGIDLSEKSIIFGESGIGKTTLLSMIGGLDKNYSGHIELPAETSVRFIYQKHNFIEHLNLYENIHIATGSGVSREDILKFIAEIGLSPLSYPSQISIGQQQKIAVARCLLGNPDFILADEPTGDLDFRQAKPVIEMLSKIKYAIVSTKGDFIIHALQNGYKEEFTVYLLKDGGIKNLGKVNSEATLMEIGLTDGLSF